MQNHEPIMANGPSHLDQDESHRAAPMRWSVLARAGLLLGALLGAVDCSAYEIGPFSLHGFAKVETGRNGNVCGDCQLLPNEERQRFWADEVVPGRHFGTEDSHVTLLQPYLGAKFELPHGYRLSGLLSQRWRDGSVDLPGFWYEKNVSISHEDYGTLTVGAFPTRAWAFADYPFGSDFGGSDTWSSTGAGYGLNRRAIRYTSRLLDVYDGDLTLEVTYDQGDTDFKIHKSRFLELWSRYYKGDLKLDVMYQDSRNGEPSSWGHAPFSGLMYTPAYDGKLGSSGQSMAMLMARYQLTPRLELGAGLRRNRWSGAYAVCVDFANGKCLWNNMFNTNWGSTDASSVPNPGFPAVSVDLTLGLRYVIGRWSANTSVVYLGKARTDNPVERGQSNSLTKVTLGGAYDFQNGFVLYGSLNAYTYGLVPQSSGCATPPASRAPGSCTLAPLSLPGNGVAGPDSRVSRSSAGVTMGATYSF